MDRDQPVGLKLQQRFPHRRASNPECAHQLPFRRQGGARRVAAVADRRRDLADDSMRKPAAGDSFEHDRVAYSLYHLRQARSWPNVAVAKSMARGTGRLPLPCG